MVNGVIFMFNLDGTADKSTNTAPWTVMSKQDDPMEIDSDSDISIDLATSKSKGKNKAKINDKRKAEKRKGKAKDTVSLPQIPYQNN
jgi:hypothetical protein